MTRIARAPALLALAAALAAAPIAPARTYASCGSDDCPVGLRARHLGGSRASFGIGYEFIDQDVVLVEDKKAPVGYLPSPDDEVETRTAAMLFLGAYSVSPRLALSAALPYMNRTHEHISNHGHGEEGEPQKSLHEGTLSEWNYSGLGDMTLLADWTALGGLHDGPSLSLQAGALFPTGRRHVPLVNGEEPEPAARPGAGAYGVLFGLHGMHLLRKGTEGERIGAASVFAGGLVRVSGTGTEEYRMGNDFQTSAGASLAVGSRLQLHTQLDARFRGKDDPGLTHALRDNTGGTAVHVTPGLSLEAGPAASFYAHVQIPVYQRVNRIGLVAPYRLLVGLETHLPH